MKTSSSLPRLLYLALALVWTHGAQASTVFWGSSFNDSLYDSSGNALDSTYSFEIGTFGSFVPTYANVDQWQSNWHVIDYAYSPDSNGWNSPEQFFVGTVGFDTDGTSHSHQDIDNNYTYNSSYSFNAGEIVYLWAFNSKDIAPSSEWALVADEVTAAPGGNPWIIPDPTDTTGSYNWNLSDASTTIIGGANGVQGPGEYSTTPGVFSLQTAVVPEPGSAVLLLAAAAAHMTRRFRRSTRSMFLS